MNQTPELEAPSFFHKMYKGEICLLPLLSSANATSKAIANLISILINPIKLANSSLARYSTLDLYQFLLQGKLTLVGAEPGYYLCSFKIPISSPVGYEAIDSKISLSTFNKYFRFAEVVRLPVTEEVAVTPLNIKLVEIERTEVVPFFQLSYGGVILSDAIYYQIALQGKHYYGLAFNPDVAAFYITCSKQYTIETPLVLNSSNQSLMFESGGVNLNNYITGVLAAYEKHTVFRNSSKPPQKEGRDSGMGNATIPVSIGSSFPRTTEVVNLLSLSTKIEVSFGYAIHTSNSWLFEDINQATFDTVGGKPVVSSVTMIHV